MAMKKVSLPSYLRSALESALYKASGMEALRVKRRITETV